MILNPILSGGSSGPILLVTVTGRTATSVTATKGGQTMSLAYDSTLDKWWAELPGTGTWTVKATKGGNTASDTVSVTDKGVYGVNLPLGRLPSGYTPLEYIQATGTQYIDTGFIPTNGFRFTASWMWIDISAWSWIASTDNSGPPYGRNGVGVNGGPNWHLNTGNVWAIGTTPSVNTKYVIEGSTIKGNCFLRLDGVKVLETADAAERHQLTLPVFCGHHPGGYDNNCKAKLYGDFKLYSGLDDTSLIRDFVPAKRASDNAIGLYDLVTGNWYGNAGTGAFVAGPEV